MRTTEVVVGTGMQNRRYAAFCDLLQYFSRTGTKERAWQTESERKKRILLGKFMSQGALPPLYSNVVRRPLHMVDEMSEVNIFLISSRWKCNLCCVSVNSGDDACKSTELIIADIRRHKSVSVCYVVRCTMTASKAIRMSRIMNNELCWLRLWIGTAIHDSLKSIRVINIKASFSNRNESLQLFDLLPARVQRPPSSKVFQLISWNKATHLVPPRHTA